MDHLFEKNRKKTAKLNDIRMILRQIHPTPGIRAGVYLPDLHASVRSTSSASAEEVFHLSAGVPGGDFAYLDFVTSPPV